METKEINNNAPLRVTEALQYHNVLTLQNDNKLNDYLQSEVKRILDGRFQRMKEGYEQDSLPTKPLDIEYVFTLIDIYGNFCREIKGSCTYTYRKDGESEVKDFTIDNPF